MIKDEKRLTFGLVPAVRRLLRLGFRSLHFWPQYLTSWYGYTERNVYYFESNEPNNATYVFIGEWEEASKLTKRDIIMGKLCYKRLIHTKKWEKNISMIMNEL